MRCAAEAVPSVRAVCGGGARESVYYYYYGFSSGMHSSVCVT